MKVTVEVLPEMIEYIESITGDYIPPGRSTEEFIERYLSVSAGGDLYSGQKAWKQQLRQFIRTDYGELGVPPDLKKLSKQDEN